MLDVQWGPRAVRLVLRDHVRELARMSERPAIEQAGQGAADVTHHQTDRPPDREVGPPARSEQVVAGVDVELAGDRSIHDHEHRGAAGRRPRPVITPARVTDPLDRRHDHRQILGLAAGHDRVDGDLLGGDGHRPVLDECDLLARRQARRLEHRAHSIRRGWDHRKTVGPALLETELDGVAGRLNLMSLGREHRRHQRLLGISGTFTVPEV